MKRFVRRLRTLFTACLGRDVLVRRDIICSKVRFGSGYGGWDLVIGGINKESVVYSFGVGEDATFDLALIQEFGLTVHAFDPTPKSIEWVGRQNFSERFVLHGFGLADFDGVASFEPPINPRHVSHRMLNSGTAPSNEFQFPVKRLTTIMQELGHLHIDVLKMDIEGAEYAALNDILESGIRPQQILIEFHHRFARDCVIKTREAIRRLRATGYALFSMSDTNEEFCFIQICK